MTKKSRHRECKNCGSIFMESRRDSELQWSKRQFCSATCGSSRVDRITSIFDRLVRYQIKSDGCWGWSGATGRHGYGSLSSRDKKVSKSPEKAHRVSYEKTFGPIPEGLHVLHRCDNPPCTNPEHLFLGTPKDNAVDRTEKGRNNPISLLNLRPGAPGIRGAN